MSKFRGIFSVSVISFSLGCSPATETLDDIDYSIVSTIDSSRNSGSVRFVNRSDTDIVCEKLNFRAVTDNPTNYLESGEEFLDERFVYARGASERQVSQLRVPRASDDFRAIATISSDCRKATVMDFCKFGLATPEEETALLELMQGDEFNCERLPRGVQYRKQVNLSNLSSVPARPFSLMPNLERVVVSEGASIAAELLDGQKIEIVYR